MDLTEPFISVTEWLSEIYTHTIDISESSILGAPLRGFEGHSYCGINICFYEIIADTSTIGTTVPNPVKITYNCKASCLGVMQMSNANGEIDIGYREIGSELNSTIWSAGFSETFKKNIVIKNPPIGRRKRQVDYGNYYEPVNSGTGCAR